MFTTVLVHIAVLAGPFKFIRGPRGSANSRLVILGIGIQQNNNWVLYQVNIVNY